MYADFKELISKVAPHRVLALNRGEKQKFLKVKLETPDEEIIDYLKRKIIVKNSPFDSILLETIKDSYDRLISPSIENELRSDLQEKAEEVFKNIPMKMEEFYDKFDKQCMNIPIFKYYDSFQMFQRISCASNEDIVTIKEKLADRISDSITEGYSYVFECVDPANDPHIIKYEKPVVFLLEVFKNQLKEEHCSWEDLISISDGLHVPLKQRELEFKTWEEFVEWKDKFTKDITQWDCKHEGYVFEDAHGFRVKFKSKFYSWWKQMRAVKDGIAGGRGIKKVYKTKEEIQVVKLMENIPRDTLKSMSIIDVEDKFYEMYGEEQ